ncbi:MAG: hypothetical protein ACM3ZR_12880 [Pseudomonadota bacterium]
MGENQFKVKTLPIKPLKTKAIEFAAMYGIISIFSFSGANSVAQSIFKNLSTFFVSDLYVDGSDLSLFANIFTAPLYIAIIVFTIVAAFIIDIILIIIMKKLYFMSVVINEEKDELLKYNKLLLAGFSVAGIVMEAVVSRSIWWVLVFLLDYLPVPLIILGSLRMNFRKIYKV